MENNQPSEWAMKKALRLSKVFAIQVFSGSERAYDVEKFNELSRELVTEVAKELDSLKSQADELARALEKLKQFHQGGHSEARIIIEQALSNYKK